MRGPILLVLLLSLTFLCTVVAQDTPSSLGKLVNFPFRFKSSLSILQWNNDQISSWQAKKITAFPDQVKQAHKSIVFLY
jgi:hypothetical protein